jgi:hypothetical protein
MKFKFGDEVKIIKGFYRNNICEVRGYSKSLFFNPQYLMWIDETKLVWIKEKNLELISVI